jgi:ketosteroid isomerase-like protein
MLPTSSCDNPPVSAALILSPQDRFAVLDIIHQFYLLVDRGRARETAALFTADASLTFGPGSPKPGTITGGAIAAAMRDRQALTDVTTRHVISNILLGAAGETRIGAHYLMTLFRADGGPRTTLPAFVADVDETFLQTPEGWKIAERTITPVFFRH